MVCKTSQISYCIIRCVKEYLDLRTQAQEYEKANNKIRIGINSFHYLWYFIAIKLIVN